MQGNEMTLSPAAEAIRLQMDNYHTQRLLLWEAEMRHKDRAKRLAESGGETSLVRALNCLATGSMRQQAPQEYELFKDPDGNPHRMVVPFAECRDLTAGVAGAGGYLVSTENLEPVDILRPWSVTARAGMMIATGLQGNQAAPRTTGKATANWLATEGTGGTASTPTLGQVQLVPHTVSVNVNVSRQLSLQGNGELFARHELLRTVGTAIDQAVLAGTGASGQPTGLVNTAGINTETGTSLAQAGVVSMKRKAADANAPDEQIAFLGTPAVRELLEKRERATGLGFIWDNDRVASRPAYVSTDVPSATLIAGAWSALYLGIWGPGFAVEINPYEPTNFKAGVIQARILVSCDVAVLHPAAFCVASSIT